MLNFALKNILAADDVEQRGSLVAEDKFRFDFNCRQALSPQQLEGVESLVNSFIRSNYPVYSREVPLETGRSISGLRAVFGEVYPNPVRVVSVKYEIDELLKDPTNSRWQDTSIEFCGGT